MLSKIKQQPFRGSPLPFCMQQQALLALRKPSSQERTWQYPHPLALLLLLQMTMTKGMRMAALLLQLVEKTQVALPTNLCKHKKVRATAVEATVKHMDQRIRALPSDPWNRLLPKSQSTGKNQPGVAEFCSLAYMVPSCTKLAAQKSITGIPCVFLVQIPHFCDVVGCLCGESYRCTCI